MDPAPITSSPAIRHTATPQLTTRDPRASTSPDPMRPPSISPTPNTRVTPSHAGTIQPLPGTPSPSSRATVHRTPQQLDRGNSPAPDLALQVCHTDKSFCPPDSNRHMWDPHLLFLELGPSSKQGEKEALVTRTNPAKTGTDQPGPSRPLHRTNKGRINKKTNSQTSLEKLDVHAFIDTPLEYAEGAQILQAIGADGITIPPHLIGPAHSPTGPAPNPTGPPSNPTGPASNPTGPAPNPTGPKKRGRPPSTSTPRRGPQTRSTQTSNVGPHLPAPQPPLDGPPPHIQAKCHSLLSTPPYSQTH